MVSPRSEADSAPPPSSSTELAVSIPPHTEAVPAPPPSKAAGAVSAAPACTVVISPVVVDVVLRISTFIFLFISMIILSVNTVSSGDGFDFEIKIGFNDFYAYRYMMASIVIGFAYALLQTAFSIFQASTGKRIGGDVLYHFDFYGDKVISYIMATGSAAGFGLTVDLNRIPEVYSGTSGFLNKANAAASLLFLGFLCSAASSVFSSLALTKKR